MIDDDDHHHHDGGVDWQETTVGAIPCGELHYQSTHCLVRLYHPEYTVCLVWLSLSVIAFVTKPLNFQPPKKLCNNLFGGTQYPFGPNNTNQTKNYQYSVATITAERCIYCMQWYHPWIAMVKRIVSKFLYFSYLYSSFFCIFPLSCFKLLFLLSSLCFDKILIFRCLLPFDCLQMHRNCQKQESLTSFPKQLLVSKNIIIIVVKIGFRTIIIVIITSHVEWRQSWLIRHLNNRSQRWTTFLFYPS